MAFSSSDIAALHGQQTALPSYVNVAGVAELQENLTILEGVMLAAAANGSKKAAEELKTLSQKYVPWKTGELHDSAFVRPEENVHGGADEDARIWAVRRVSFTVRGKTFQANRLTLNWQAGYSAPHAWMLHENPNNYTIVENPPGAPPGGPRQEKYLQLARDIMALKYKDFIAGEIGTEVRKATFVQTKAAVARAFTALGGPVGKPRLIKRVG